MEFEDYVVLAAQVVEGTGVLVVLVGAALAAGIVAVRYSRGETGDNYQLFRRYLGRAILLGLEFLVAADIIRTVSHDPTINGVVVLALIVLIRTFLSFTIELEVEGRWPWQKAPSA
ncbi:MAG: DUF1622 domain-containing protein [Pseudomonadota bacterium]|nr:DUF1622 domain-containing protein [Pseudomonadota bacterium]